MWIVLNPLAKSFCSKEQQNQGDIHIGKGRTLSSTVQPITTGKAPGEIGDIHIGKGRTLPSTVHRITRGKPPGERGGIHIGKGSSLSSTKQPITTGKAPGEMGVFTLVKVEPSRVLYKL